MLFAIIFGLSMDYEVFLLSRVRRSTTDRRLRHAVADGLAKTAQVITAAAAIMVVVFGSFVFEDDRTAKLFGIGFALAVLLDATIVRMLLVPATMELLGDRNWWMPTWLDRIIPKLNVDGPAHHEPIVGTADDPAPPVDSDWPIHEPGVPPTPHARRPGGGGEVIEAHADDPGGRARPVVPLTPPDGRLRDGRGGYRRTERHKMASEQPRCYSSRRPLMARAMTSCWICSVPSKMS